MALPDAAGLLLRELRSLDVPRQQAFEARHTLQRERLIYRQSAGLNPLDHQKD